MGLVTSWSSPAQVLCPFPEGHRLGCAEGPTPTSQQPSVHRVCFESGMGLLFHLCKGRVETPIPRLTVYLAD